LVGFYRFCRRYPFYGKLANGRSRQSSSGGISDERAFARGCRCRIGHHRLRPKSTFGKPRLSRTGMSHYPFARCATARDCPYCVSAGWLFHRPAWRRRLRQWLRLVAVAMLAVTAWDVAVDCLLATVGAATHAKTALVADATYAAGLPGALLADSVPIRAAIPSRTILLLAPPRARRPIRTTPPVAREIFCKPTRLRSDPIECGIWIAEFGILENLREGNRAQASRHSCKEARQDDWLFSLRDSTRVRR